MSQDTHTKQLEALVKALTTRMTALEAKIKGLETDVKSLDVDVVKLVRSKGLMDDNVRDIVAMIAALQKKVK